MIYDSILLFGVVDLEGSFCISYTHDETMIAQRISFIRIKILLEKHHTI